MNASQLVAAVKTNAHVAPLSSSITDAQVLGWLNEAVRQYQDGRSFPWLDSTSSVTLVAGQRDYSLPAGWLTVRYVRFRADDSEFDLEQVSQVEMADLSLSQRGRPELFSIEGESLRVWPAPAEGGDVLDVAVTSTDVTLVTSPSANTPLLPAVLHDLLVSHAVGQVFAFGGNLEEASRCAPITSVESRRAIAALAARRRGRPRHRRMGW